MAWQTPKTDWTGADGVRFGDLNRIEGNILALYNEGMRADKVVYINASTGNDDSGVGTSAAPYKTIAKALNSLPRMSHKYTVELNIAAGTYNEDVVIRGFTGSIALYSAGQITIKSLVIDGVSVYQSGYNVTLTAGIDLKNGAVYVGQGGMLISGGYTGIDVQSGSTFVVYNTVTINNTSTAAIEVASCSRLYVQTLAGTGNATGILAINGGVAAYDTMSLSATTQRFTNGGGRIYSGAQTNVPNY